MGNETNNSLAYPPGNCNNHWHSNCSITFPWAYLAYLANFTHLAHPNPIITRGDITYHQIGRWYVIGLRQCQAIPLDKAEFVPGAEIAFRDGRYYHSVLC